VRNYKSKLLKELGSRGVHLGGHEDWPLFVEVVDGLMSRPDATIPPDERWDVQRLLTYWDNRPRNAALSTTELRLKVISLCMVVGLTRPSDLARWDLRTLQQEASHIRIRVFRSKNSGPGFSEPVVLPFGGRNQTKRCAARALLDYVHRTRAERELVGPLAHGVIPVFISTTKPLRALSSQRISSLMKPLLADLGVNARVYSARGNATVAAIQAGVPVDTVQKAGRWRSAQVMSQHYMRALDTTQVGTAILGKRKRK
jgi:integrase